MRIALVGAGKIGEAFLSGVLSGGVDPGEVSVVETDGGRVQAIQQKYRVQVRSLHDAVAGSEVVVVAVKPHDVHIVLSALQDVEREGAPGPERLLVSLVAGVTTDHYEAGLSAGAPVVRVMPNTPMLVRKAMSAVCRGRFATDEHLEIVIGLLSSVGEVVVVPEAQMHAVTALSGSGPGYFFLIAEALVDAGVRLGLPRDLATELAAHTMVGAGTMLVEAGQTPTALRAAVTSPAGTTAEGIAELEKHGVRSAFYAALAAAAERSRELGGR